MLGDSLPGPGSGNHAVTVAGLAVRLDDRNGFMTAVPNSRRRFWEMYGRFPNVDQGSAMVHRTYRRSIHHTRKSAITATTI
jgi:hypothetical protein